MIIGLTIPQFTALHVVLSLIGIAAGFVAMGAYMAGRWMPKMAALFLATTVATTLGGFLFPIGAFTPALGVGIVSTIILALALVALYGYGLRGRARAVYAVTATIGLYLNTFVLIAQGFLKVPALHDLAPNGNEPAFLVAQVALLALMLFMGWKAFRKTPLQA